MFYKALCAQPKIMVKCNLIVEMNTILVLHIQKKSFYARNIHLGSIVFFEENNLHDNSKTI